MAKMRPFIVGSVTITLASFLTLSAFKTNQEVPPGIMPANVKAIIDRSCFECHHSGSKDKKGREALDFTTFEGLTSVQKASRLKQIADVIKEDEMPPKKYVERNPGKKLTEAEKAAVTTWTAEEMKKLRKQ